MSSSNSSETQSPGPSVAKKQPSSESANNESSDGKDLLQYLKGQVSFARQCLGLLQNQMKHAMDTLEILQDQVIKAQSTIDKIERKGSKERDQKAQPAVSCSDHPTADDPAASGSGHLHGHRMLIVSSTGQPLYTVDNTAMQHQSGLCHCSSCNDIGLGHPVFISEQNQQVVALHQGQSVYHVDGKPVNTPGCSIHELNSKKNEHRTTTSDHTSPKKRKHSFSDIEDAPSPRKTASESDTGPNEGKSSPIASQLLQVLDVLQNAGDDDNKESVLSCKSSRGIAVPFTGPIPLNPVHSASGTGILSVSRRCRKQDITPFKREDLGLLAHKTERDHPDLMRVPPPVLAATLEPDFLVVPGNSYFSDSPPSSAGGAGCEKLSPPERKSSESRDMSFTDIKKEHIENTLQHPPPSGRSSISQASDSPSRSAMEYLEKNSNMDVLKRDDTTADIVSRINKIKDPDNIVPVPVRSNGESHITTVTSIDSYGTTTSRSRMSLLNSDASEPLSPSNLSPKKSPVRLIKVSPLNSAVSSNSGIELRRPSFEYASNHGIVRISSATSMTSPMTSPKQASLESAELPNKTPKTDVTSCVNTGVGDEDLQMVTTYSVAQIGNSDDRKCASPSKRPNILSKSRNQNKKDIPQGIVVLVPTIEDAKQLIKSSGGNQGKTPVLVPQNVLSQISSNGEPSKANPDSRVKSSFIEKRPQYTDSNLSYSRTKRVLTESMVTD